MSLLCNLALCPGCQKFVPVGWPYCAGCGARVHAPAAAPRDASLLRPVAVQFAKDMRVIDEAPLGAPNHCQWGLSCNERGCPLACAINSKDVWHPKDGCRCAYHLRREPVDIVASEFDRRDAEIETLRGQIRDGDARLGAARCRATAGAYREAEFRIRRMLATQDSVRKCAAMIADDLAHLASVSADEAERLASASTAPAGESAAPTNDRTNLLTLIAVVEAIRTQQCVACFISEEPCRTCGGKKCDGPCEDHEEAVGIDEMLQAMRVPTSTAPVTAPECTGTSASWCPVCGDCTCQPREAAVTTPEPTRKP